MSATPPLWRRAVAEALGTCLLVAAVVGSGIAAANMSPNDTGLALLENAIATGAALVAIILAVGPISGAHLNPAVTLSTRLLGGIATPDALVYVAAQLAGGILGTVLANLMFDLSAISMSTQVRSGGGLWLSETVATFGLVFMIYAIIRSGRAWMAPFAVGAYITAAYWWSSSTSFANPAVTVARMFSDTFTGIAPESVPAFVIAQVAGAVLAVVAVDALHPTVDVPEPALEPFGDLPGTTTREDLHEEAQL
ncbi:MAG: aquaporin family protein [Actinobacteria bacterium ATB1]|nr:aquaporin family protein [Actinobacteria bacterium ATB1]